MKKKKSEELSKADAINGFTIAAGKQIKSKIHKNRTLGKKPGQITAVLC